MTFPDQLRMDHVTEALWGTGGGASVMVGSGFSRNARPKRPNGSPMPMLEDIAAQLHRELYPDDLDRRSPPERLAQEYKVECGETKLNQVLRNMIADPDFLPGPFHERLLKMPWCDVFTTNWDTLLETAREKVPERPYTVVRARSDLPSSSRPRIVKLHGSLPHPPLILTEECYRTYPSTHAPFVNTVQQAMMETVVLLLGFSGDDSNFLHWSGWVRDNLGDAAPKIYLAGYLRMSRTRRRMLEARHIIPIDLAGHPRVGDWGPDHLCHRWATDWILTSLECGKPYDQTRWPRPPPKPREIDPRIEPVAIRRSACPVAEPKITPPQAASVEADLREVANAVDAWRHNREYYPGWIVFPQDMRSTQRSTVERWTPFILDVLPNMALLGRLDVIYEVVWRLEKSLARMPETFETAAHEVLDAIDCQAQTVDSKSVSTDWTRIRAKWREVALALLTAARYRLDAAGFEARLELLDDYVNDDPDVADRINQERCLWSLWELDYESLEASLGRWDAHGADPMWKVRKGALLRSVGQNEEADTLVREAMAEIRAAPLARQDFAAASREGWALWGTVSVEDFEAIRERWRQLGPMKCDAADVWDLRNALKHGDKDEQPTPNFDLGARRTVHRWFTSDRGRYAATYGSVRLTEVAGLPNAVESVDVARSLLKLAAERLVHVDHQLAIRLVLRAADIDSDGSLLRVLSRERVAALPKEAARRLCDAAQRLALHAIGRVEAGVHIERMPWLKRARVVLEGWSRLILRTDNETAERALRDALMLHGRSMHFWLHDALGNLLRRSWEAIRADDRQTSVLDILEAVIPRDDKTGVVSRYPEPGDLLFGLERPPERTPENEARWTQVVETLVQGLGKGGIVRERASRRLYAIADWGLLIETEAAQAAAGWWGPGANDDSPLPIGTTLHDYTFIVMPEPSRGMGRRAFGRKWLSGDVSEVALTSLYKKGSAVGFSVTHQNPQEADDILYQTGGAIAFLRERGRRLALSSSEMTFVTGIVDRWTETNLRCPKDIPEFFVTPARQSLAGAIHGLGWLLSDVRVPASLAQALSRKVKELHDARLTEKGIPAFAILPGILRSAPELLDDVELTVAQGLASADDDMTRSAFRSLHRWLLWEADENLPSPPIHLVRELGFSIAARRRPATEEALSVAQWIFEKGRTGHRDVIRDLVLAGMRFLLEELRYDRQAADATALDIPLTRWGCIRVARAIAAEDSDMPEVVRQWLELGRGDPLPEVRHVAADAEFDGNRWNDLHDTGATKESARTSVVEEGGADD